MMDQARNSTVFSNCQATYEKEFCCLKNQVILSFFTERIGLTPPLFTCQFLLAFYGPTSPYTTNVVECSLIIGLLIKRDGWNIKKLLIWWGCKLMEMGANSPRVLMSSPLQFSYIECNLTKTTFSQIHIKDFYQKLFYP